MGVSSPEIGAVLPGDYILEAKLGDTTGHVYRARRQRDGRMVVARIFQPGVPLMAADFLELAQTASKIKHPSLANVEAYGRFGDRACFIVSEFVQGQALDEWADEVGIPPLGQVIELVRRVCLALQAAGRSGLAHDSLNPSNVMVQKSAHGAGPRLLVKVLDLGVPAFLAPREPRAAAVRFMAPEQLDALASEDRSVAFRCTGTMNVYSCGCLLYYLCTGGPPYPGATIAELRAAHLAARMAPPVRINPQISPAFNALILRALSLDPSERFANVAQLAEALSNVSNSLHANSKSSQPPASVQAVVPLMNTPVPDDDEPPTFKTARPPELYVELQAESGSGTDAQTMPPGPNMGPGDVGPPIGLFSSAPPWQRRSPPPAPPLTATGERATPLALFSEPPPPLRGQNNIIVAKAQPLANSLMGPYDPHAVRRSRQWRRQGFGGWLWPMGAAACVAGYFVITRLLAAPPAPIAAIEPAANSGSVVQQTAPAANQPRPGARVPEPTAEAASPPSRVNTAEPQTTSEAQRAVQVAVIERSRDRGRGRPAVRGGNGRDSRAADNMPAEPVREELNEARNTEPAVVTSPERDAAVSHGRPALLVVEKPVAVEPATKGVTASAPPRPTPTRVEPALPLRATVTIQGITVRGSLPTSLVRRAVERLRSQLAACYARSAQLAGRNAFGELSVEVQIDERGRARKPSSHGGGLPQLDACVADAASKLVSEKAPDTGTVNASWKVAFTP
jgi:serine/threonine protein kinase